MIKLATFLNSSGLVFDREKTKVHLATWNGTEHPIDLYYAGEFKDWQEVQTRRNFNCDTVLGLIHLGNEDWLFAGLYKVLNQSPDVDAQKLYRYQTELLPGQDDLIGRIFVRHKRTRNSYIWWKKEIDLVIKEIRPVKMSVGEFPGYNWVDIDYNTLRIIIDQQIESWHAALSNIRGVYLITDSSSGELYVGKASGSHGIWERWCAYARSGHGGNKFLKEVLASKGKDHALNFRFTILEIADLKATEKDILARESHWMKVLGSRTWGLN